MTQFSLGKKLIVGGLVLLLIPLLGVGIFSVLWSSSSMERQASEDLDGMRNAVIEQVNQTLKVQTDLLSNAGQHDAVIMDIVKATAASGVYEMMDFKLNVASTIFHDSGTYEFFIWYHSSRNPANSVLTFYFFGNNLAPERLERPGSKSQPLRERMFGSLVVVHTGTTF